MSVAALFLVVVLGQVPVEPPVALRLPEIRRAVASGPAGLEARMSELACRHPELGLPGLPTLPLTRAGAVERCFYPRVAQLAFDEYRELARMLPPEELAGVTRVYSEYAAAFTRAWCEQASPAICGAFWPEFRVALVMVRPAEANRHHRVLLDFADAALASIPPALADGEGLREAIARDRAALGLPWFDDACRRARDKWAALDAERAREELMVLTCPKFQADYLEIYAEPPVGPASTRYWSSLVLGALTSIADSSPSWVDAAGLLDEARVFPVSLTAGRTIEPTALAELSERAARMIRTGLSTTLPEAEGRLSRGTRTDYPRINGQIARLAGEDAFTDESRDRWAYRLRAVLGFLASGQECELLLLGPEHQTPVAGTTPAAMVLPEVDVTIGTSLAAGPFYTERALETGVVFQVPGPRVALAFQGTAIAATVVELPRPWSVLTLLRQPGACIDERLDPAGRVVKAPLMFTDASGRRLCYWVGLRFERPPPSLAEWPSDADWPH